ncbi:hypothetical protein C8J25_101838 [Sphingomonas faeni]|uniref:Uncharacterized protein n=1 Tax=Sphingomonas faeni TaxID=185950 RepID=A0A2T5UCV0_9SPHN|nr:hypothetical protein [Sphingomonas faeni]PTW49330.1 hypothetical protein C8J25_101838 [Sphingomonas faeni]
MAKYDFHQLIVAAHEAALEDTLTDAMRLEILEQAQIIRADPDAWINEWKMPNGGYCHPLNAKNSHDEAYRQTHSHMMYFRKKNLPKLEAYTTRFPDNGITVDDWTGQFIFPDDDTKIHFMMATPN